MERHRKVLRRCYASLVLVVCFATLGVCLVGMALYGVSKAKAEPVRAKNAQTYQPNPHRLRSLTPEEQDAYREYLLDKQWEEDNFKE